jgi:type IV secretory pathway ATPase VirB11/archaellum biosynthesis ATPase/Flp pilus assembly protein TadB
MAVKGVCITIRKFFSEKLTMNDLIKFGSITKEAADFLESAVKAKTNIIVSGGGTSGKTTLLNILTNLTEEDDRIFTIEDSVELDINRPHVVKLESRPANSEGRGEVTIRDLIKFANRSRPDRIVAGELRNGAVFDFLQACNSGVNGSMASVHAQSIEVVKKRLINLMQQAGFELPENFYGEMIQNGIDIIVQVTRLKDGTRKVTQISEVVDYDSEGKHIITKPIFEWVMEGMKDGKMLGELHYTGYKLSDNLNDKFDRENIDINKVLSELTEKGDEFPVESQLSDCLLYIADALKSGHAISNAIGMVAKEMEGPLGNEFLETYHLMESGKMFKESLIDMKKRVNHPDFNFFTNALIIQYDTGAPSEPVLRKLVKIMDDNSIIRQSVPFYKKKKVFNGKDWQLIEFVELLSMVVPSCKNLEDALLRVCQVLNNEVTKEFQVALDEMNSGRRQRDALKDAAIRINMQEAKSLVSQINQAETFGVSVEKTLIDQGMKLRKLFKLKNKINY